jgi:hypothetical protein
MTKKIKVRELPSKIKEVREIRREESDLEEDVSHVPDDAVVESGSGSFGGVKILGAQSAAGRNPINFDAPEREKKPEATGTQLYDSARGRTDEEEREYISAYGSDTSRPTGELNRPVRGNIRPLGGSAFEQSFSGNIEGTNEPNLNIEHFQDKRSKIHRGPDDRRYESSPGGKDMQVKRRKEMY